MARLAWICTVAVALHGPLTAMADEIEAGEIIVPDAPAVVEEVDVAVVECDCDDSANQGMVALALGFEIPTAYFFRGYLQERDGFIIQPYASVGIELWENDAGRSLSLLGGVWTSIQTNKTGFSGSGPSNWYEADFFGGVGIGLSEHVELELIYTAYTSPNDAFSTVQEVDVELSIDDGDWLGDFALSPYMLWAFEVDGTRSVSALGPTGLPLDPGSYLVEEGVYVELGAEPGYEFGSGSRYPVTLSVPLSLGLDVSDYYAQTFGFFDFGVQLGVPLAFIDERFGSWTATAAFHGISLSGSLANVDRGDGFFPYGVFSLGMVY